MTNNCFDHGLPTLHIRVLNTLIPKSLEPNSYVGHHLFKKNLIIIIIIITKLDSLCKKLVGGSD